MGLAMPINSVFTDVAEPLADLLDRDDVYDLCINAPHLVYLSTSKGWEKVERPEITQAWCESFIKVVSNHASQITDRNSPLLSTELETGERIQAVVPPAAKHHSITIRRPQKNFIPIENYTNSGLLTKSRRHDLSKEHPVVEAKRLYDANDSAEACLRYCIDNKLNIIFSGSTGSGKTTIANTLATLIDTNDRIISIEDAAEMTFTQGNNVSLFYPRNKKGAAVTADDLLASCLRMAPDRIIFGELRGSEAFFYIDQINTGHSGSITTIHANSAEKALKRLLKLIKRSDEGRGFSNEELLEDVAEEVHAIFQWHSHGIDHAYFPPIEAMN